MGLKDVTLESLGEDDRVPNTYSRDKRPIDTILATRGVEVSKAGYLPFVKGVGDHHPLFVGIVISSVLGVKLPSTETATTMLGQKHLYLLEK